MTMDHSPRHRASGPDGFGRSPWPLVPVAVIPSPRRAREDAGTPEPGGSGHVPGPRRPLVPLRVRPRVAAPAEMVDPQPAAASGENGEAGVGGRSSPRHAEPDGLADVADLETVTSTPAPVVSRGRPLDPSGEEMIRVPGATRRNPPVCRSTSPDLRTPDSGPGEAAAPRAPTSAARGVRTRCRSWALGGVAILVVLTGAAAVTVLVTGALASPVAAPPSPWAAAPAPREAAVGPVAPAPAPAEANTLAGPTGTTVAGDGRHVVGVDVAPGTYRSAGPPSGDGGCSWSRRTTSSRGTEAVVASGVSRGPATVTIRRGDTAFVTRGCAPWTRQPGS